MEQLFDYAASRDIEIEYVPLAVHDGEYRHDLQRIRLRRGMSYRMQRSILAHELGHATYADVPSPYGPVHHKQERRADEWAAAHLIRFEAYRDAEITRDGHVPSIAYDLGVICRLVVAYRNIIVREHPDLLEQEPA